MVLAQLDKIIGDASWHKISDYFFFEYHDSLCFVVDF